MTVDDLKRRPEPVVLVILDGWGIATRWGGNALAQARPKHFTRLWHEYPHAVLQAVAPQDISLGGVGSSDTGHASIGTGRLVASDIADVSAAIADGSFFRSPAIKALADRVSTEHSALHLVGLTSSGALHSHVDHLYGFLEAARQAGAGSVFVHAISDGVDVADGSARSQLTSIQRHMLEAGVGRFASVSGRRYAMDRSGSWRQTRTALRALTGHSGRQAASLDELWQQVEAGHEQDADIVPTMLTDASGAPVGAIRPNDVVVFWNVRRDRMTQLVRAFADSSALAWLGLFRSEPLVGAHVRTLTDYQLQLPDVEPLFRSSAASESLGRILSDHGIAHARVFSTDRSAHMTYYLNGGQVEPFSGEARIVVPLHSNDPRAQAAEGVRAITRQVTKLIGQRQHPVIIVNFDAVDRAAHSGDMNATVNAITAVDQALGEIHSAVAAIRGTLLVTADHGNAESMLQSRSGRRHTSHGVPFIVGLPESRRVIRSQDRQFSLPTGLPDSHRSLADIAPTILAMFGIAKPSTMTGRSLLP